MKKLAIMNCMILKTAILLFPLILTSLYSSGQNKFAYHKNNDLYISSLEGGALF